MSLAALRLPDITKAAAATLATPTGGPLAALERGRATARLLRHPKLLPHAELISPHLPRLAPHAQRILDHLEHDLNPHIPILVEEALLPRLLPFLGPLLDELPRLSAHLHLLLPHRAWLLPCLDKIVPHLPALRPHHAAIARSMPVLAPHVMRLAPYLPSLLPHLDRMLRHIDVLAPHLAELSSDELLPHLVPQVGAFAAHLDELAPHLPRLLHALRDGRLPRHALPPLLASLPTLLPSHLGPLLAQSERIGAERLPAMLARPHDLIAELRAHAPPGSSYGSAAAGGTADGGGAADGSGGAGGDLGGGAEDEGGWLQGVLNFFGGGGAGGGAGGGGAGAEAATRRGDAAHGERELEGRLGPKVDLTKVNAALESASRALAALEDEFVSIKKGHANHMAAEQNAAVQCARLEATLADVDDGLQVLAKKTHLLASRVEVAEAGLTAEQLMYAREARQVEVINGRRDGLFTLPAWERASSGLPPPPPQLWPAGHPAPTEAPPPLGSPARRSSVIEDDWLSKIAL